MTTAQRLVPVVLQHGAGQDGEIWSEVAPRLRRPIHVHESPGHGGRFGDPYDVLEDLADDLVAHTPDASDDHGSVLVGHSLGGAIVLQAALDHPEAVLGAVVICTGVPRLTDARFRDALDAGDLDAVIDLIRPAFVPLTGEGDPVHARSAARLARIWRRSGLRAIAADYDAVDGGSLHERLAPLDVPVAVLGGGEDRMVTPRRVHELAEALGVEAQIVPGCSHQLPWEEPASVAIAVERVRAAAMQALVA